MIIVKSDDVAAGESKGAIVKTGPIFRKILVDEKDSGGLGIVSVDFAPGARLNFHVHSHEQILYVTSGKGILATRTEEHIVTPGTVVSIPPGEDHWHGATKDSSFSHIALYKGDTVVNE